MAALNDTLKKIEKKFGKGSIMQLGDNPVMDVEAISSGSLGLNVALGIGGYPKGRVVEIYGPESSGKTTLALHAIADVQKNGGIAAFIDAEHAIDVNYAKNLGVDVKNLVLSQPDSGEEALEIAEQLTLSGAVDLIVVDSVAALTPRAEIDGEMGDSHIGLQARLMSQALRKLASNLNRSGTTAIFINQIREKVGVMFGSPETTPGGRALKFYASVRVDIRRRSQIKDQADVVGNLTKAKIVKNKVAPPFKEAEFNILYGEGISFESELLKIGVDLEIVDKSGAWYSYDGERLGQGEENSRKFLKDNPEMKEEITDLIYEKLEIETTKNEKEEK